VGEKPSDRSTKELQIQVYTVLEGWGRVSATNPLLGFVLQFYFIPQGIRCDYLEFDFIAAAEDVVVHRLAKPGIEVGFADPTALPPYEDVLNDLKRVHPYFQTTVDPLGIVRAKRQVSELDEIGSRDRALIDQLADEQIHEAISTRISSEARLFLLCIVDILFLNPDVEALQALIAGQFEIFYSLTFQRLERELAEVSEDLDAEVGQPSSND
jgi:hypothetical protein